MMRKLSWILPTMLASSVYAEDEKEVVVESAEELKEITVKQNLEERPKMVLILAGSLG